jgi:ADP-ribosylglycohydrolase
MRAAPMAVLRDWDAAAAQDCALTNPSPNCVAAVRAYVCAAQALLRGATPLAATDAALSHIMERGGPAPVIASITEGRGRVKRDIAGKDNKGWTLHALYCAFFALGMPGSTYQDRIDTIIRFGGDTDTNAAIAGALVGAWLGETAMRAEERTAQNIAAVLACDPTAGDIPRPPKYSAKRLTKLADALASI